MKKIFVFIGFTFAILGCNKEESVQPNPIPSLVSNATVMYRGLDCGNSYLIKFNANVTGVPQNFTDNVFYEINLPNQYKVNGLPLNVTFRQPSNNELMNCSSLGLAYPQIFIETATE